MILVPALIEETGGSPSFPGDPISALPCSRIPGGPPRQTIAAFRYCPRYVQHEDSPITSFEIQSHGFTARCLRLKTPFLVANQGSLPVGGQPFPDGMVPVRSHCGFQVLVTFSFASPFGLVLVRFTSALPASQGFGWRQNVKVQSRTAESALRNQSWGLNVHEKFCSRRAVR